MWATAEGRGEGGRALLRASFNENIVSFSCALTQEPLTEIVLDEMNQGFREVWLLDGRMTMEDRLWLSTFHNRFHGGSSATLAEKFEFKDEILGKWKVHADKKGICSKSESGGES